MEKYHDYIYSPRSKRSKEEMQYEEDQMERQKGFCLTCGRRILRGQTTIYVDGVIYHSGCVAR